MMRSKMYKIGILAVMLMTVTGLIGCADKSAVNETVEETDEPIDGGSEGSGSYNTDKDTDLGNIVTAEIGFDNSSYEYPESDLEKLIHGTYDIRIERTDAGAKVSVTVTDSYSMTRRFDFEADKKVLDELQNVIKEHEVAKLDGYYKRDSALGEGFDLEIVYESGDKISAHAEGGYAVMPDKYWDEKWFLAYIDKVLREYDYYLDEEEDQLEDIGEVDIPEYVIENPGWEYYCDADRQAADDHVKLTLISADANEITDTDIWLSNIGEQLPDSNQREDGDYRYYFYGGENYSGYMIDLVDLETSELFATLNLYNMYYSDDQVDPDWDFVEQRVKHAVSKDGILYLCMSHNTYASASPHNAYIMALDMNDDYRVIWKSEPLTCNANNFVVEGNSIICGYGFTDEPDYLYVLDRSTGERVEAIKLKTGPEYFYVKDYETDSRVERRLYVRTYDTDYEFLVE